ncbi:MAG: DUF1015 domain-containing protein [Chloroflexota bacterium]|nr:DUF1015 domain-containing protein [Chloroflexota bacterium]
MVDVRPFRGLHYDPAVVGDLGAVVCPPYDVIDAADERRLLDRHPNNAVRLELTTASVAGDPDERYARAAEMLRAWREQGVLVRDATPAFYLHEATFPLGEGTKTRRELIAAVGLAPWDRRVVLPHERTFDRPKADRLRLLEATATNLSPILAFFRRDGSAAEAIEAAWRWTASQFPLGEGTDAEGVGHRLWELPAGDLADNLTAFFADRPMFIADGHHRYETALHYLETRQRQAGGDLPPDHPARFVLMHLIAEDDPGLVILPLHRLLRGLRDLDRAALLDRLRASFEIEERTIAPDATAEDLSRPLAERGTHGQAFGLYGPTPGAFALLTHRAGQPLPAGIPPDRDPSWRALDVVLVDATVVRPLIEERRLHAEDALDYTRDARDAAERVNARAVDLAVLVNPTRVEQVAAVARAGERMPEKSTYFYPKAPTGLVFRLLSDE